MQFVDTIANVTVSSPTGFPLISITLARSCETESSLTSRLGIDCGLAERSMFTGSVLVNSRFFDALTVAFAAAVAVTMAMPTESWGLYGNITCPVELVLRGLLSYSSG